MIAFVLTLSSLPKDNYDFRFSQTSGLRSKQLMCSV